MRKFKVGDRVRCYGQNHSGWFDVINAEGDTGKIIDLIGPAEIRVEMDNDYGDGRFCLFHPKQCRKLKPKKRREIWIEKSDIPNLGYARQVIVSAEEDCNDNINYVRFIEAPKRRKS